MQAKCRPGKRHASGFAVAMKAPLARSFSGTIAIAVRSIRMENGSGDGTGAKPLVVITGAAGRIGTALAKALEKDIESKSNNLNTKFLDMGGS